MSFNLSRELVGEYNTILMQMDIMPRSWYEKLETYYRLAHQREKKLDRAFEKLLGEEECSTQESRPARNGAHLPGPAARATASTALQMATELPPVPAWPIIAWPGGRQSAGN